MFCILDWWTRVIFRWSDYFLVQIFQILSFPDSFFIRFFLFQILSCPDSFFFRIFLFQNLSFPDSFFSRFFLFQILYFPDSFFFRFFLFQILSFSDSFFSQLVLVHLSFHQVRFFLFSVFRDCSCFDFFLRGIPSKFCCCEFFVFISHLFSDSFFSRFSFGALFRAFGFGDVVCRCFGKFCVAIMLFFCSCSIWILFVVAQILFWSFSELLLLQKWNTAVFGKFGSELTLFFSSVSAYFFFVDQKLVNMNISVFLICSFKKIIWFVSANIVYRSWAD